MALWLVRAAQTKDIPPRVLRFLRRHEEEEIEHLRRFEQMLGIDSSRAAPPRAPDLWGVLAVHLYGYETLGLEFAKLLVDVRPDLASILSDEEGHVMFFENEVRNILLEDGSLAERSREAARSWRRRLPRTVDRYLRDESLALFRDDLRRSILDAIDNRFALIRLCNQRRFL